MTNPAQLNRESIRQVVDLFWETLPPFWHKVRAHIRQVAAENFGITVEQFHVLRHIRKGLGSASELAEAKQISRAAVSQAVEALVQKGLVSRAQDPQDRRHVRLSLTAEGENLLGSIFQNTRQWMAQVLAPLSEEELQTMAQAMESLKKVL